MTLSKLNINELRDLARDFCIIIPERLTDKPKIIDYMDKKINPSKTETQTIPA